MQIQLPDELTAQAQAEAAEQGLTLDEFVMRCVRASLLKSRAQDPLFADNAVFGGQTPQDLAENHDEYLYGDRP